MSFGDRPRRGVPRPSFIRSTVVLCLFLAWGRPTTGAAQTRTLTIPDTPVCSTCSIIITEQVRLGDLDGPGMLGEQSFIHTFDGERYFVTGPQISGMVLEYDSDGRFVGTIGRPGEGPGEFRLPRVVFADRDVVRVFDLRLGRFSTFGPDGLEDTRRLEYFVGSATWIGGGRYALERQIRSTEGDLDMIPIYDESVDSIVMEIGYDESLGRPEHVQELGRRASPGSVGIWVSQATAYVIERWNQSGEVDLRILREAEWFPPNVPYTGMAHEVRPPTRAFPVMEDQNGLLWTFSQVADEDWAPIEAEESEIEGHVYISSEQDHRLYDTIIEVIDPVSGRLLVRERFPHSIETRPVDGMIFTFDGSELHHPRYIGWSLTLEGWQVPR